jgi:hypothetical protein
LLTANGSAYAQANRNRILSDAIPALTLPVGANSLPIIGADRNLDMEATFETSWPAARSSGSEAFKWHHSDYVYVAYPFTYTLFNEIVNSGNLN